MNDSQALQKIEPMPMAPSVEAMITLAIERGATVETIERLMAVRREVRAEQAKEAYDRALAEFQAECPTIQKTAKVMNKDGRSVRYQYAPLDAIIHQVKGLLQKHGFSYTVNAKAEPTSVKAVCKLTHSYGHSEISEFEVPIDADAYMNPAQRVASALTFAKRYAFCNAAGIMTGDADDDSISSHDKERGTQTTQRQQSANVPRGKSEKPASKPAVPEIATEEQRVRWIAELKLRGDWALGYCYDKTWLLPESGPDDDRTPGEPLEMLEARHVPTTRKAADAILAELDGLIPADQRPKPAGASRPSDRLERTGEPHESLREPISESEEDLGHSGGESSEPEDGVEVITGKLEAVSKKDGRSGKGPWTRYGVKIGDEWYGTFSKPLGELAQKDKGHTVRIQFRRGERGNDLVSIERAGNA